MRTYSHRQGRTKGLKMAELQSATKRINQRLRQLEKSGVAQASNWYKYVERLQYDDSSIVTSTKDGKLKIRTDITKMSRNELKALKNFLTKTNESKTSTVKGVRQMYQKGFESYKQTTGSNISLEDYTNLYSDNRFKAIIQKYGYSETMSLIDYGLGMGLDIDSILNELLASDSILDAMKRMSKTELEDEYNVTDNNFQEVDLDYLSQFLGFK